MSTRRPTPTGKITPLVIVASFLTLTEVVLGYAVTRVTDGVQVALTAFVITYAVFVAVAFFVILWNRPWVFYAPSEYGNVDPGKFMSAMREAPAVAMQMENLKKFAEDPGDEEAKFSLIDAMADDIEIQFAIFMYEKNVDVSRSSPYVYEHQEGSAGSGSLSIYGRGNRLEGSGLVRVTGNGGILSLTEEGRRFADWVIKKGRKCSYFWTPKGSWGTPKPGGPAEKMLEQRQQWEKQSNRIEPTPTTVTPTAGQSGMPIASSNQS
jgi:hypothetical protein